MNDDLEIPCAICGAYCKRKHIIEARKSIYYWVCQDCFNKYEFSGMKEIRKRIKKVSL